MQHHETKDWGMGHKNKRQQVSDAAKHLLHKHDIHMSTKPMIRKTNEDINGKNAVFNEVK